MVLSSILLGLAMSGAGQTDLRSDTWGTADGLGRTVLPGKTGNGLRSGKTVGMFYFLANHVPGAPVYDITKLLAQDPARPKYGPYGSAHWWGEPWMGYYQSDDPWVIRKHMQMLANAGVDVIIFDNTNGPTYPDVYLPLCSVLEEMKKQGLKAPQVAFFTGHGAWSTLERDFYGKKMFSDLWFQWKGKPLMMVHLDKGDALPPEISQNFSVRESWAWTPSEWFGNGHDKWPWLDNYPQNYGWHESKDRPEEVSVSVGQHATSSIGRSSLAQHEPVLNSQKLSPETPNGLCFEQQFERALKIDPEFIFITGWNEWTATRFKLEQAQIMAGKPEPAGGSFFVDEYNAEFSRDIEPANGILQDNYYYQLCSFVRRYKGSRHNASATDVAINLKGPFSQWARVENEYLDPTGDTGHRDHAGWGSEHYVNATGRNDIVAAKVAYDQASVYFYVRTKDPLTSSSDPAWMLLFLNVGGRYDKGWMGYDFAIDRQVGHDSASIEKNVDGTYRWISVGRVKWRAAGNELMISVPRKLLGPGTTIDFKWADNIAQTGEPSDFTLNGDVAPDDRFNYRTTLGG